MLVWKQGACEEQRMEKGLALALLVCAARAVTNCSDRLAEVGYNYAVFRPATFGLLFVYQRKLDTNRADGKMLSGEVEWLRMGKPLEEALVALRGVAEGHWALLCAWYADRTCCLPLQHRPCRTQNLASTFGHTSVEGKSVVLDAGLLLYEPAQLAFPVRLGARVELSSGSAQRSEEASALLNPTVGRHVVSLHFSGFVTSLNKVCKDRRHGLSIRVPANFTSARMSASFSMDFTEVPLSDEETLINPSAPFYSDSWATQSPEDFDTGGVQIFGLDFVFIATPHAGSEEMEQRCGALDPVLPGSPSAKPAFRLASIATITALHLICRL